MGVSLFSPAKLNLFLAITGRRPDGFHDLVSVAAPLDFGDRLEAEKSGPGAGSSGQFTLECDQTEVPLDGSNLVLKAAKAYVAATGWTQVVRFRLTKRIPVGAGLGGGSSNAVAALRALNELSGGLLDETRLAAMAATLGSDCALFLQRAPAVMRGRGEKVEPLSHDAAARLRGRRVLIFKPSFGISTPWAYGRMVARGTDSLPAPDAEARLSRWLGGNAPAEELLLNNMEAAAFEKYPALPLLLARLRREAGVAAAMSGSGSACYVLLRDDQPVPAELIRACWGRETFIQEARLD
ncbi:MAG TPA: 4-(cytidine 5'-diphospho)-2-C-methyl-D-erythritol kinase [Lacunisphaera sp.]